MQIATCEWIDHKDRPGSHIVVLFGTTEHGQSASVVVRGVSPSMTVLVPEELGADLVQAFKDSLPARHKIAGTVVGRDRVAMTFTTLDGVRWAESLCARPFKDGEWRINPALVRGANAHRGVDMGNPCTVTLQTLDRRANPAMRVLSEAGMSIGSWVTIPPRHPGTMLSTTCVHEGNVMAKDIRTISKPRAENAPKRVTCVKLGVDGTVCIASDLGGIDEEVCVGTPPVVGNLLANYIRRADPDVLVVWSTAELAEISSKLPSHALSWGRARLAPDITPERCSGRVILEAFEIVRSTSTGTLATARVMLGAFMHEKFAVKHRIAVFPRPSFTLGRTEDEESARIGRIREQDGKENVHALDSLEVAQVLRAACCAADNGVWVDPVNSIAHPIVVYKGRRMFVQMPS